MRVMLARLFRRRPAGPLWLEPGELHSRLDRGAAPMIIDVRGSDEFDGRDVAVPRGGMRGWSAGG
jgi:hypothetical protein